MSDFPRTGPHHDPAAPSHIRAAVACSRTSSIPRRGALCYFRVAVWQHDGSSEKNPRRARVEQEPRQYIEEGRRRSLVAWSVEHQPVQPTWRDFKIDEKPLFAECETYLKLAQNLLDEARIISQRVHGNESLTTPA